MLIAVVLASVYMDRPMTGQELTEKIIKDVAPLVSSGNASLANELIAKYAESNHLIKVKIIDSNAGLMVDYSSGVSDEFRLARINLGAGISEGVASTINLPIFFNGAKVGDIQVVKNQANDSVRYFYIVMLLLLLSSGLYINRNAFDLKLFLSQFKFTDRRAERVQSQLFLEDAVGQMGLTIHFNDFKKLDKNRVSPVGAFSGVYVRWVSNGREAFHSLSEMAELISRNALILPITPWIYREFFNKKMSGSEQGGRCMTSFNVSVQQFHDQDFREFIVDLANSMKMPLDNLCVEIDEVALSRLNIQDVEYSWESWDEAGVGVMVSNFGKTTLSKHLLENFKLAGIKWCLSWLRYQRYSSVSKDRILHLQQLAISHGVENVVSGAFADLDMELLKEFNFDWLEESVIVGSVVDASENTIYPI